MDNDKELFIKLQAMKAIYIYRILTEGLMTRVIVWLLSFKKIVDIIRAILLVDE